MSESRWAGERSAPSGRDIVVHEAHRSAPIAQWVAMTEYEFRNLYLPRGTTRGGATQLLTAQAEYGRWELARLRLYPDGSRRVVLRRKVIRAVRTA
jgi:hypothetical protein